MKKWGLFFLTVIVVLPWLIGCATVDPYLQADEEFSQERYGESALTIERDRDNLYRDLDTILYYLDKGMLSHYAGDYSGSFDLLQSGERAIEEAFTKSVTQEIGSYIVNDTVREYPGEDYEDIYINAFNAMNFYHMGNIESAMVEIRRMNNKIRFLSSKYGAVVSNMQQKAMEDSAEIPPSEEIGANQFVDSALGRYLSLLFYRTGGQLDDARIDRDAIKLAYANAPGLYPFSVPASLEEELEIPPGKARLNILGFTGRSPIKEEKEIRVPLPGPRWIKIALPVMVNRPSQVGRIEVLVSDGSRFNLELLEDIEAAARETYKEREKVIYMKSIIRGTAKGVASSAMDVAGDQVGGTAGLILGIASLGTQVAAEASEQADLRISRYFPGKAYVGGVTLDPGAYTLQINFYSFAGSLLSSQTREVNLDSQTLNLQEILCLR